MKANIIIQRFHPNLVGGAEYHANLLSKALQGIGYDVTILTTTSRNHLEWDNSYPQGEQFIDAIRVIRFPPRIPRITSLLRLLKIIIEISRFLHLPKFCQKFMSSFFLIVQGPYIPELKKYLKRNPTSLNIFYCYLYYPAVQCSKSCSEFILIPTLHDEFTLYLEDIKDLMKRASLILLQTPAEQELLQNTFANYGSTKVGAFGINLPHQLQFTENKYNLPDQEPYLFFAGRIGPGKKIPMLIDYLAEINKHRTIPYKLYLAGILEADYSLPLHPWLIHLGFISEEVKFSYISGAMAVVNPSSLESLSILAIEALIMGRPLIVNSECDVLREYSTWSALCLSFRDLNSFENSLKNLAELLETPAYHEVALNTKNEVLRRFNWENTTSAIQDFACKVR